MKIWDKELLDKYAKKHAGADSALQRWIDIRRRVALAVAQRIKADFSFC